METSNIILAVFAISAVLLQVFGQRWSSGFAKLFARSSHAAVARSGYRAPHPSAVTRARAPSGLTLRGFAWPQRASTLAVGRARA